MSEQAGKFLLRLPEELRQKVTEAAEQEETRTGRRTSMTDWIVDAIRTKLASLPIPAATAGPLGPMPTYGIRPEIGSWLEELYWRAHAGREIRVDAMTGVDWDNAIVIGADGKPVDHVELAKGATGTLKVPAVMGVDPAP